MTANKNGALVSRRSFIAGMATGAAGGIVVGSATGPDLHGNRPWDREADVVVVGGGAAGCTAALSAAEHGADVMVLETAPVLGGAGAVCIGSISVPLSGLQRESGIVDSVEAFVEDVMYRAGRNASRMDGKLLQLLAENGGRTIDWLRRVGVDIEGPFEYPAHRVKRMHMLMPKSSAWPKVIRPVLESENVNILTETKGVELYKNSANRVIGIKAIDRRSGRSMDILARKAVIMTAGNLEANPALVGRVTAPEIAALPAAVGTHDGSGLMMAAAIGSATTMLDGIGKPQVRGRPPGPGVSSLGKQDWMPYGIVDAGAILVNKKGRRFTNEQIRGALMCLDLEKQPYKTCYLVFDKMVADIFNEWPMVMCSLPGVGDVSKLGGWGIVDDLIARQGIKKAGTIEDLAVAAGVDPGGLKAQIEAWNSHCEAGRDPAFGRQTFGHEDAGTLGVGIRVPPFYCHSPLRALVLPADTSLVVDTGLRVLDVFGRVIEGLYAGGDMGHGDLLLTNTGHGLNMAWALTSGRLGGKFAAGHRSWT